MQSNRAFDELRLKLLKEIYTLDETKPLPERFQKDFLKLVELVCFQLMHKKENFFGNCLIQMQREIKLDLKAAVVIASENIYFKIYFNPFIFLKCSVLEMQSEIKHQIYHLLFLHLKRFKYVKNKYSSLALNIAMDISVNQFLDNLPYWEWTLEKVSDELKIRLEKNKPFEVYAEIIQKALMEQKINSEGDISFEKQNEVQDEDEHEEKKMNGKKHSEESCHDIWEASGGEMSMENIEALVKKMSDNANRGNLPQKVEEALSSLNKKAQINWQDVLKKMVGSLPISYKKTITRKDRRQPKRLDLRGKISDHIIKVIVAIDTSGSMQEDDIRKGIIEIFSILQKFKNEVTIIEIDQKIQDIYRAKSPRDIRLKVKGRGGTAFSPVFEYMNHKKMRNHLLIYFTDGEGEDELSVKPINFRTLWILTGKSKKLSLEKACGQVVNLN